MVSSHVSRFLDEVVILESFKLMILFFFAAKCLDMWGNVGRFGVYWGS